MGVDGGPTDERPNDPVRRRESHPRQQLTSLTAALETLPLGRGSLAVVGSESSAQAEAREVQLAGSALALVHRDRLAPTHDTKAVRTAGPASCIRFSGTDCRFFG